MYGKIRFRWIILHFENVIGLTVFCKISQLLHSTWSPLYQLHCKGWMATKFIRPQSRGIICVCGVQYCRHFKKLNPKPKTIPELKSLLLRDDLLQTFVNVSSACVLAGGRRSEHQVGPWIFSKKYVDWNLLAVLVTVTHQ